MTPSKYDSLEAWQVAYLRDVKLRGLSAHTVKYYRVELTLFVEYCHAQDVTEVNKVTADLVRSYLEYLEADRKRNTGGIHASYRAIRAFLRWYALEADPENWKSPLDRVKVARPKDEPLRPIPSADLSAMLATCRDGFTGIRDKALLMALMDTGARAAEFIALGIDDADLITGAVIIKNGKGGKTRSVFIGKKTRRAIRAYLKARDDNCPALWVTDERTQLTVAGLRQVLIRRAGKAGIETPTAHQFRRAFALALHRAKVDLISIARLMGHSDLATLARYLRQDNADLQDAHARGSPVDRLL